MAKTVIEADDGPALYYVSTDGLVFHLDAPWPRMLNPRERALCIALLDFARDSLTNPLLDMAVPISAPLAQG